VELHASVTREREAGAQALADYIEILRQILSRETGELGLQGLPKQQDAENTLRDAQERAAEARHICKTFVPC
jgi:hypothetical protein